MKMGSRFFALTVVTSIALNADNIIIANRLGASAVTEYAVPAKIASLLGLLVTTLFLPLWPAYGEALARRDYSWIRRSTFRMSIVGGGAVLCAGTMLLLFGDKIINLWMGRDFQNSIQILAALVFLSVLMAVASPFQMLLNSTGRIRIQFSAWIVFAIVSISLKYYFLSSQRIWIMPLVSAIAYFVIVIPKIMVESKSVINDSNIN